MNLRPRRIDIYIVKQFGLLFFGALVICQFVLMMQFLWRYTEDLIGKGLSLEILGKFFWYMGLMLVPQALPLAILLSSLITFGNLGENCELPAIKASGISIMKTFRSLIFLSIVACCCSFYFQNTIGPRSCLKMSQLLFSMKHTNPELEIPEGRFYNGLPKTSIYVEQKDMETGKLYGVVIYTTLNKKISSGDMYKDQSIILADSGMIQSTAEKKHLLITLWNGEWSENMNSRDLGGKAAVPYRREKFNTKHLIIDFDSEFKMEDEDNFTGRANVKGLKEIVQSIDSLQTAYKIQSRYIYEDQTPRFYALPKVKDGVEKTASKSKPENVDSVYAHLTKEKRQSALKMSTARVGETAGALVIQKDIARQQNKNIRLHQIEAITKFTLAFSCIIFFFIGAPLGAIIRKGGLGVPVIISVVVFIIYYILTTLGTRFVKSGEWNVWFGTLLATAVLTPVAAFVTYKANNDSVVFNIDAYKEVFMRLLGLRSKRHIWKKEVIIDNPDYQQDAITLDEISRDVTTYAREHSLRKLPNPIKVFFLYEPDHEIERINEKLENTIEDLSNTSDKHILRELNRYPIMAVKAHTRPFEDRRLNIASAIILPIGIFQYCRMVRFRMRLYHDLVVIKDVNQKITEHISTL